MERLFTIDVQLNPAIPASEQETCAPLLARYPFLKEVAAAAQLLHPDIRFFPHHLEHAARWMEAVNPAFPQDSFDAETLLRLYCCLALSPELYPLFFDLLPEEWRENRTEIKANADVCQFRFAGRISKDGPLCHVCITGNEVMGFPYTVEVIRWQDMDLEANHSEFCPMFHPDEHDASCPVTILQGEAQKREISEGEWKRAEAECECASDDCNCEPDIEVSTVRTWAGESEKIAEEIAAFIREGLWSEKNGGWTCLQFQG